MKSFYHALIDLRKLEVYASLDPLALERRCRNRGLWASTASKSMLLQRLRIFEEYWAHRTKDLELKNMEGLGLGAMDGSGTMGPSSMEMVVPAPEDLDGVPVEVTELTRWEKLRVSYVEGVFESWSMWYIQLNVYRCRRSF